MPNCHLALYGDSQFVRLSAFLQKQNNSSKLLDIQVKYNLTKSGITISQLKRLVKIAKPQLEPNLIHLIFIATNDIKNKRTFVQLKQDFLSLLSVFRKFNKNNAKLVLVQIPPFPKYQNDNVILHNIFLFNQLIASVRSTHISFITWEFKQNISLYFQQHYATSGRTDQIHLNSLGFAQLLRQLKQISDK